MKKILLTCAFFAAMSSSAFAFVPQTNFYLNREVAIARVWNTSWQPIACYGQAFGRTWNGVVLNAWVNGVVIYPQTSVDVYVHSNFYDPFVQAWANIDCQYVW